MNIEGTELWMSAPAMGYARFSCFSAFIESAAFDPISLIICRALARSNGLAGQLWAGAHRLMNRPGLDELCNLA